MSLPENYSSLPTPEKMAIKRAHRLESTPDRYKALFRQVHGGSRSFTRCIKAMCLECVGFEVKAVRECTGYACPLYNVRPYQRGDSEDDTEQ